MKRFYSFMLVFILLHSVNLLVAEEKKNLPIGMTGKLEQVVIPGSELEVKPIEDATPVILRIVESYPHGTDFRYDIEYYGLQEGEFNLILFLQRKDESELKEIPPVTVAIRSILPKDRIEPNRVRMQSVHRLGGYKVWVMTSAILWVLGLIAIFALRRKKESTHVNPETRQLSLADRLRPLVNNAIKKEATTGELADLEMMLVCLWRKRLKMEDQPASQSVIALRQHAHAGPLLLQLEQWLHSPHHNTEVDIKEMLKPYQDLPHDSFEVIEHQTI